MAANSVGTKQLKDGAVTSPKLAANSVGTGKVSDGSLFKRDFKPGQLPAGARSFDFHMKNGTDTSQIVNGITIDYSCDNTTSNGSDFIPIYTEVSRRGGGDFYVIGTQATDGALASKRFAGDIMYLSANSTLDLDVMMRVNPGGKWASFRLGSGYVGSRGGCNFGGLITPPSN